MLTVQGIQALDPNDNYCPKQPIFQNTAQCVGVAAVSAWRSLYSDAETAVGANAYHSEKSPELAHQQDLRDRSQIHSRVLNLKSKIQNPKLFLPIRFRYFCFIAVADGAVFFSCLLIYHVFLLIFPGS